MRPGSIPSRISAGIRSAITQRGSPLSFSSSRRRRFFNIDPTTIKFQALQSNGVVASAVAGNQVDTAVQTSAPAYALVEKGDAKILGWFSDVLSGRQGEAIFTSTKIANERPQAVRGFLAGMRKAMVYWDTAFVDAKGDRQNGPTSGEAIAIIAKELHQPESVVKAGIPYYDRQARISMKDMAASLAWYKSQNMVKPNVELAPMVDKRYVIEMPEEVMTQEFTTEDVEYLRRGDKPLLARLYRPRGPGPHPAVIEVHGGAWTTNDRLANVVIHEALARAGVFVMAMDFRMPPEAQYPASICDINYAIALVEAAR